VDAIRIFKEGCAIGRFDTRNLQALFLKIVKHKLIDKYRLLPGPEQLHPTRVPMDIVEETYAADPEPLPVQTEELRYKLFAIADDMDQHSQVRSPPTYREILEHKFDGKNSTQIGDAYGISNVVVRQRLLTMRDKIRQRLPEYKDMISTVGLLGNPHSDIRLAQHHEAEQVIRFFEQNLEPDHSAVYSEEFYCPFGLRGAINRGQVIIAIIDSKIVAAARVYPRKGKPIVSLYQFAIDPAHRGQGLLLQLLDDLQQEYEEIEVKCPNDSPFNAYYEKTGWSLKSTDDKFNLWVLKGYSDVVNTPKTVVIGALEKDGRYLVSKRKAPSDYPGTWEFGGGKVEPGESLENALVREFREEYGIKVRVKKFLGSFSTPINGHVFALELIGGEPKPLVAEEVRWVTLDQADKLKKRPAAYQKVLDIVRRSLDPETVGQPRGPHYSAFGQPSGVTIPKDLADKLRPWAERPYDVVNQLCTLVDKKMFVPQDLAITVIENLQRFVNRHTLDKEDRDELESLILWLETIVYYDTPVDDGTVGMVGKKLKSYRPMILQSWKTLKESYTPIYEISGQAVPPTFDDFVRIIFYDFSYKKGASAIQALLSMAMPFLDVLRETDPYAHKNYEQLYYLGDRIIQLYDEFINTYLDAHSQFQMIAMNLTGPLSGEDLEYVEQHREVYTPFWIALVKDIGRLLNLLVESAARIPEEGLITNLVSVLYFLEDAHFDDAEILLRQIYSRIRPFYKRCDVSQPEFFESWWNIILAKNAQIKDDGPFDPFTLGNQVVGQARGSVDVPQQLALELNEWRDYYPINILCDEAFSERPVGVSVIKGALDELSSIPPVDSRERRELNNLIRKLSLLVEWAQ